MCFQGVRRKEGNMVAIQMSFTSDLYLQWKNFLAGAMTGFVPVFLEKVDGEYKEDEANLDHCFQMGMTVFDAMEQCIHDNSHYAKFEITDEEYAAFIKASNESPIIFDGTTDAKNGAIIGRLAYPRRVY